jgi:hypothetical protein
MGLGDLVREEVRERVGEEWEWRDGKYLGDLEREICLHGR